MGKKCCILISFYFAKCWEILKNSPGKKWPPCLVLYWSQKIVGGGDYVYLSLCQKAIKVKMEMSFGWYDLKLQIISVKVLLGRNYITPAVTDLQMWRRLVEMWRTLSSIIEIWLLVNAINCILCLLSMDLDKMKKEFFRCGCLGFTWHLMGVSVYLDCMCLFHFSKSWTILKS